LIAGSVAYDDEPAKGTRSDEDIPATRSAVTRRRWTPLPGTAVELESVKELAARRHVHALTGSDASVNRILSELRRTDWAHLATHGFFADPEVKSGVQNELASLRFGPGGERVGVTGRNPLLLSGLVLAGANRPVGRDRFGVPIGDGGVLTAESIAALPLANLRLAILSACETGLGESAGGEGVFGLQRAFHQAGARRVMASLWKVDDQATVALMIRFYQLHWRDGQPALAALRSAQLELYRHPKRIRELTADRGGLERIDISKMTTAQPRLWAAFVLSGTDRDELIGLARDLAPPR
jgi:CHAT domain-containing protein